MDNEDVTCLLAHGRVLMLKEALRQMESKAGPSATLFDDIDLPFLNDCPADGRIAIVREIVRRIEFSIQLAADTGSTVAEIEQMITEMEEEDRLKKEREDRELNELKEEPTTA